MLTLNWEDFEKMAEAADILKEATYGGTGPFPELTPDVMNNWMGIWEESFMAEGPIDPPRALKEKLEAEFIDKVYKLDKDILDILLINNNNDPMEFIWDVYIDDLTEDQENIIYQAYCDTVNDLGLNTHAAFDVREDEDED